jgi:hypothetical protein
MIYLEFNLRFLNFATYLYIIQELLERKLEILNFTIYLYINSNDDPNHVKFNNYSINVNIKKIQTNLDLF